MRYCDLTFAYTDTSGGIRTYIDHKRRFIAEHTTDEHVLIVPGERDLVQRDGRLTQVEIKSPVIPGAAPYRIFPGPGPVHQALVEQTPDLIELGSVFVAPWAAFRYRAECQESGRRCPVTAYFHTDIAHTYVGAPLRRWLAGELAGFSELLAHWGERVGDWAEEGAESAFGSVFRRCDLTLAATPAQAARLSRYGVRDTAIIPLGVDLNHYGPHRRDPAWRRALGVAEDEWLLLYCGRLDSEKAVKVLVDAFICLPESPRFHLALMGEGPLREQLEAEADARERLHVLPYERDPGRYAERLASADIYVTAGPYETFGLAVVEAEASGLPVVGVDAGALRERVQPAWGRLGPVGDARSMAKNILAVARERDRLGAVARDHVLEAGHDWSDSFSKLFGHSARLLKSEPRGTGA
ncbi:GDP-mannose-dependent alpha-(1-6)-phosphatidylinositol dimannoside mannosyltransferase [Thiorhodovibrio winogradskyi]|uniref:GDP-mannose-dependent alpha-(1-6)-phosphatidylinositol dimannoside mannosyltransferase n=1 Tax=Thiorhodovibrio winogradskyi TaxID=77007 RepID=A0ABZ0S8Y3_9GAMM|nr:glycosyltransferase [Thiorhodovibrio winogradskyi]